MANHNDLGKLGEEKAFAFLKASGYSILARNWRYKSKELDCIATKNHELVVIEVKTRSIMPENLSDVLGHKKQQFIKAAANAYITQNNIDLPCRFDLLLIIHEGDNWRFQQIESAFSP